MKRDDAVGIDLRAIRNRFETRIRCVAVAARPEVAPYRRGHGVPGGHALPRGMVRMEVAPVGET